MTPIIAEVAHYWYEALRAPLGIKIQTDNIDTLHSRLTQAKRALDDPQLSALRIIKGPVPDQVWIVPNAPQGPPPASQDDPETISG